MFSKKEKDLKEEINETNEIKEEKTCDCGNDCKCNHEDPKEDILAQKDEEIGKLKAEVEDWKQSYLRKQAEFQNFTKRKEREMEELRQFASEQVITKLLAGLDNLERAIEASEATKDFDGLVKGVEMILGQLKSIMETEGVEHIKTEGKYDPVYHHAVMVEDNPDFEDDHIILELQKGYTMKGKVIRPSMVKVCKKG
ncbi:nucleotide exchange factor GrpE [Fusobacterium sp.]|uniref:nucleotide exchange factor GrpE n=1 Tax=Fusobacterium sp. TaxID=68766 RepID=UPI00396CE2B4